MSGVIDEDGTQWEHCNNCDDWYNLTAGEGFYEEPTPEHEYGRDLCKLCFYFPDLQVAHAKRRADNMAQRDRVAAKVIADLRAEATAQPGGVSTIRVVDYCNLDADGNPTESSFTTDFKEN